MEDDRDLDEWARNMSDDQRLELIVDYISLLVSQYKALGFSQKKARLSFDNLVLADMDNERGKIVGPMVFDTVWELN